MSGRRVLIPAGLGVVEFDLQGIADAAYAGDDRAFEMLMIPGGANGSVVKRVMPLHDERRAGMDLGAGYDELNFNNPRVLCADSAFYTLTAAGTLRVLPCALQVIAASTAPAMQRVTATAKLTAHMDSPQFAASPAGRVDTLYATVAWDTPAGGSRARRVKNTSTGVVATADTAVYADLLVTLHVAAGTEGSSTPGAMPADGTLSWNFKLAEVVLAPGYTLNGLLLNIRQSWERATLNEQVVRGVRSGVQGSYTNADAGLGATWATSSRFAEAIRVRSTFRNTAAAARVVLDKAHDWRNREARITLLRAASHTPGGGYGEFPPVDMVTTGGTSKRMDTGWLHTGAQGNVATNSTAFWTSGGSPTARLFANNTSGLPMGALVLEIDDAPDDTANGGDHWTVIAEALDRNAE